MTHLEHNREGVAIVRLAHGKANALDTEFCSHLAERFDALAADAGVRAAIVTADGGIFSAGVDLLRLIDGGAGYMGTFLPSLHAMCVALFAFPKPLVAAVNGHAIAGGCIITCAADRRLMSGGRIGVPELLVGVPFPAAPLEVMRYAVAPPALQHVIYDSGAYEPDQAIALGLVDERVEPGALLGRALEWAERLAGYGAAFRHTKAALRAPALERMRAGDQAAAERWWSSEETLGAVRAYVEKTLRPRGEKARS